MFSLNARLASVNHLQEVWLAGITGNARLGVKVRAGRIGTVFVDYDETITAGRSADLQVATVLKGRAERMESKEEAANFVQERKALIGRLGQEYEDDFKKTLMGIFAKYPRQSFDLEVIESAMQDLAAFDQRWFDKTVEIEALAGIGEETFLAAALMTPAKDLAIETVNALQAEGMRVVVASINWSGRWIQRTIGVREDEAASDDGAKVGPIEVYSNDIVFENGVSTSNLEIVMMTGIDKARVVDKILEESKNGINVFIGDSVNDVIPLCKVDLGIVMDQNKATLKFADHFGIQIKPLSQLGELENLKSAESKVLYTTDSWAEVATTLLGKEKARKLVQVGNV